MATFNINHVISKHKLDFNSLAAELFPDNKYPIQALKRVTNERAFLDTNQLDLLSKIIGVPVSDMFLSETWSLDKTEQDKIVFHKNEYRIELDQKTLVTNIFHKNKLIAEETIIPDKNIIASEYFELVNKVIINLI